MNCIPTTKEESIEVCRCGYNVRTGDNVSLQAAVSAGPSVVVLSLLLALPSLCKGGEVHLCVLWV